MSTNSDPLIGRVLGSYRIERVLGRGGMAVVYYATDAQLRRPAALKVIDARFRGDTGYAERFIAEARVVATWRHEHILQVYSAGEQDGLYYFAMEYIDGQDLSSLLSEYAARGERVPQAEILRIGRAVAEALDYAHARGVIHRDVKPSNILIASDGRVVLGDFGLAMDVHQGSFGEVFGSAQYIAPEQARRSNAAVPQSDLYALGVMLYEMLAGRVPFDDPSPTAVALQHLTQPVPSPREANPDLSQGVEQVLLRALAKDPEQRYPSGAALMQALEDGLATSGAPVMAKANPLRSERLAGLLKPRGALIAAAALFLVLILGAALLSGLSLLRQISAKTAGAASTHTATAQPLAGLDAGSLASATPAGLASNTPSPAALVTAAPATTAPVTTTAPPAPAAAPSPTWTPRYPGGRRMVLYWNETSFYMLQVTGYGEAIQPVVFERLDASGAGAQRFGGRGWADFSPSSLRNYCYRLLVGGPNDPPGGVSYLEPPQCKKQYMATLYPPAGDATLFWTSQPGTTTFRVLWGRTEIQRCPISAGTCEVYLP